MQTLEQPLVEAAPPEWAAARVSETIGLHQIAPYIGKLKPYIAGVLLERFTHPGEVVLDCFCGSGTIPLECVARGRSVIAADANPYAVALTRAKLESPATLRSALERLDRRLADASRRIVSIDNIPDWVKRFFHPETLVETLAFADECIEQDDQFLLACLLGILHHQRPGFLSYPSSHLVPYLRDRKYPREQYPEMYDKRDLRPRMVKKVLRTLKSSHPSAWPGDAVARTIATDIRTLELSTDVDAIVTSPPYMNALDYLRDNRLRLWFLDRSVANYSPEPTDKRDQFDSLVDAFVVNALAHLRVGGLCVLVVGENVKRKRLESHPADRMLKRIRDSMPGMVLRATIEDTIPDVRRARRTSIATKKELILVLERRQQNT